MRILFLVATNWIFGIKSLYNANSICITKETQRTIAYKSYQKEPACVTSELSFSFCSNVWFFVRCISSFRVLVSSSIVSISVVPFCHYAIDANTSNKLRGQLNKVCVFVWLSFHFVGNSSPTRNGENAKRTKVAFFYMPQKYQWMHHGISSIHSTLHILYTLERIHFLYFCFIHSVFHCRKIRQHDEMLLYCNNVSSF